MSISSVQVGSSEKLGRILLLSLASFHGKSPKDSWEGGLMESTICHCSIQHQQPFSLTAYNGKAGSKTQHTMSGKLQYQTKGL